MSVNQLNKMIIGEKIKAALKAKGITQSELSINIGMARQNISKLLKSNDIKLSVLIKISNAINTPLIELLGDGSNEDVNDKKRQPKYLEQRIEDLEARVKKIENMREITELNRMNTD